MRDPNVLVQTGQVYERGAITRHVEAGRVIEAQGLALQVERDAELAHMLGDDAHAYWHVAIRHTRCPLTQQEVPQGQNPYIQQIHPLRSMIATWLEQHPDYKSDDEDE
ncbi:hypothetical protein T492DRAFT_912799 [Pavlovales sp. CCMP2436]|nr:hypothetical protein T492DRAFT_912799 [Pavlovales sp. CCMP2436]